LLSTIDSGAAGVIYANRNLSYRDRFSVLKDVTITLASPGTSAAHVPFHLFIPCKYSVTYNGSGDSIGGIATNALYVAALSDNTVDDKVVWVCNCRMRFSDN